MQSGERSVAGSDGFGVGAQLSACYSPNLAAGAILDGCCDEVLFGRLSFADPEFPNEIATTGTIDPKKVCVTCGKCGVLIRAGKLTGCVVRMPHPYLDILRSMNT